jgi:hypothetical protein
MPLLKAEAEKLSQEQLVQGIVEEIITVNQMFGLLPFSFGVGQGLPLQA